MAQIKKDTSLRKAILQAAITGQLISSCHSELLWEVGDSPSVLSFRATGGSLGIFQQKICKSENYAYFCALF